MHLVLLSTVRVAKYIEVELFLALFCFGFFVEEALAVDGFACADGDGDLCEEDVHFR